MQFLQQLITAAILAGAILPSFAHAAGSTGATAVTNVKAEGGRIYVTGAFANPDTCASSSIIVLSPVSPQEQEAMLSMLLTALVSGKHVSLWVSGCAPSNWFASIPSAVTVDIYR